MFLVLDIGNTTIQIGVYENDKLIVKSRITTGISMMEDQYAIEFKNILGLYEIDASKIDGAIISSVVPPLTERIAVAVRKLIGKKALIAGPGLKNGLNIRVDNPASVGADIVAGCVAAASKYELPCIVCDFGTAISMFVLDAKGTVKGGVIHPGISVSLEALRQRTSLLTNVALKKPNHVIGTNTEDCMLSGAVIGTAAMLDGLCERIEEELGEKCTVVCSGKTAENIVIFCKHDIIYDEDLILDGLSQIYRKNVKPVNPA